jgi:hypothetical protein
MARGEDPASASTSFFICTGECRTLDGKYTVFARVVRGMDVVQAIGASPVEGETPKEKIALVRVRVIGGRTSPPLQSAADGRTMRRSFQIGEWPWLGSSGSARSRWLLPSRFPPARSFP